MRELLRKSVAIALTGSALGLVSTQASAFTATSIGTSTGSTLAVSGSSGIRSYADYGTNSNFGWVHTPGWWTLQVGTAADISAGNTFDVKLRITPNNSTTNPMFNPGFSVWTNGTNPVADASGFHTWNQVRGPNDNSITTNDPLGGVGNIVDGHNGWIGTANAGPGFTNADADIVNHGAEWNASSPYFNSTASSGGAGTLSSSTNFAELNPFD
ncbi:MAG: hypothetical protein H6R26_350 [Proteobacteria bacterium]|nr:hypothetical protein [Pseudomonadota bacterium]